jgi:radical SAM superfamily enzyme
MQHYDNIIWQESHRGECHILRALRRCDWSFASHFIVALQDEQLTFDCLMMEYMRVLYTESLDAIEIHSLHMNKNKKHQHVFKRM